MEKEYQIFGIRAIIEAINAGKRSRQGFCTERRPGRPNARITKSPKTKQH
jgi:hypothetical protein